MRKWRVKCFRRRRLEPEVIGAFIETALLIAMGGSAVAQTADGAAGISQATSTIAGYFDAGCNLVYAIGAIVGLVTAGRFGRLTLERFPDELRPRLQAAGFKVVFSIPA